MDHIEMRDIDKLRRISNWPIVSKKRLNELQLNKPGEWIPAGKEEYGYQMYWSPRSGGIWVRQ